MKRPCGKGCVNTDTGTIDELSKLESSFATLRVEEGALVLAVDSKGSEALSPGCMKRSQLLQDIFSSSEDSCSACLPVSADAFETWMRHVNKTSTRAPAAPAARQECLRGDPCSQLTAIHDRDKIEELFELYMAADVLIDESTRAEAAQKIAGILQGPGGKDPLLLDQVTSLLPDHLVLDALSHVALPHALLHHPRSITRRALRAHHPSIDSSRSLFLHHLPTYASDPALAASATLTQLRNLSFAGLTFLPDHPSLFPFAFLSSLRDLTAISFSNTGLSQPAIVAIAAGLLPALPLLATADLSDNVISADAMHALVAAIARCASLQRLDLAKTVFFSPDGRAAMDTLSAHVTALSRLSCLSIGVRGHVELYDVDDVTARCPHDLLRAARCLPRLQELRIAYRNFAAASGCAAAADALAGMTQLKALLYHVPCVPPRESDHRCACCSGATPFSGQQGPAQGGALAGDIVDSGDTGVAAGLRALTQLTALELCFDQRDAHSGDSAPWRPWLAAAGELTGLRCLTVRYSGDLVEDATALADSLAMLRSLSSLQIHDAVPESPVFEAAVTAACALPAIRRLHAPVSTAHSSAACRRALLGATHVTHLTLDMHVAKRGTAPSGIKLWLPLVPHATHLHIAVQTAAEWLKPLVPVVAAHSTLRSLKVSAWAPPRRGALRDLLQSAASLPSLRELALDLAIGCCGDPDPELPAVPYALRHCVSPGLTSLNLVSSGGAYDFVHATACAEALTNLRSLRCKHGVDAHVACMAAMPQLALHTLMIETVGLKDLPLLRELLGRLPHLRELRIWGVHRSAADAIRQLRPDVAALPVCDTIDVAGRTLDVL